MRPQQHKAWPSPLQGSSQRLGAQGRIHRLTLTLSASRPSRKGWSSSHAQCNTLSPPSSRNERVRWAPLSLQQSDTSPVLCMKEALETQGTSSRDGQPGLCSGTTPTGSPQGSRQASAQVAVTAQSGPEGMKHPAGFGGTGKCHIARLYLASQKSQS